MSFALGAFFAGMVLRESQFIRRAAEETLPLRDAFAVLFFVSVGMLFDPGVLVDEPLKVLAVVAIIVVGRSLAAALLVLLFRYPLNTALSVSASLAQIGEFSFILAAPGLSLGLLSPLGQSLIAAGALMSIALNPLVFAASQPALRWIRERSALARSPDRSDDPLAELPTSTTRASCATRWSSSPTAASGRASPSSSPARTAIWSRSCAKPAMRRCWATPSSRPR